LYDSIAEIKFKIDSHDVEKAWKRSTDELILTSMMSTLKSMIHHNSQKMHDECVELLMQLYCINIAEIKSKIDSNNVKNAWKQFLDELKLSSMTSTLKNMKHPQAKTMHGECVESLVHTALLHEHCRNQIQNLFQ
jgi:hypothetical protein